MHATFLENARAALQPHKPFEWLYVKKGNNSVIATYVVTPRDEPNHILYFHSVDLKTGQTVAREIHPDVYAAGSCLDAHYRPDHVQDDGFALMQEFCVDHDKYASGSMPYHVVFGKNVYHADLDELHLGNDEMLCF